MRFAWPIFGMVSVVMAVTSKEQWETIKMENEERRSHINVLKGRLAQEHKLLQELQKDHVEMTKERNRLEQQLDSMSGAEHSLLKQLKETETNILQNVQNADDLADKHADTTHLVAGTHIQRQKNIERLFLLLFLWQVEVEVAQSDQRYRTIVETSGVLLSTGALYLSGGSSLFMVDGLRWYLGRKIQNSILDFIVRQTVAHSHKVIFYAGGTLLNELRLYTAKQARIMLHLTNEHVMQVKHMLEDEKELHGDLFDATVTSMATPEGLKAWLELSDDNRRYHDQCVNDIRRMIQRDAKIIRDEGLKGEPTTLLITQ